MSTDLTRARRAFELGRLRSAAARALLVVALVALIGRFTSGSSSLALLPLTFALWVFVHWRGQALLAGAMYGLSGGVVTTLLPLSLLRPCCAPGMDMSAMSEMGAACCTMPGACVGAGAVVGMLVAAVIPFGRSSWWKTALGIALGMASVVVLKCATLALGEMVGLVGGLLAGIVASTGARLLLRARATR